MRIKIGDPIAKPNFVQRVIHGAFGPLGLFMWFASLIGYFGGQCLIAAILMIVDIIILCIYFYLDTIYFMPEYYAIGYWRDE